LKKKLKFSNFDKFRKFEKRLRTNVQLTGVYPQLLRYFIHQPQIFPDRLQASNNIVQIRQGHSVRVFRQLFGNNFATGL